MFRFYEWHVYQQSGLVMLAGLICLLACLVSLSLTVHARAGDAYRPRILLAAALVFAAGLAATLFVFMLVFQPAIPLSYRLGATLLSVAAAMAIASCALALALHLRAAWLDDFVSQSMAACWRGRGRRRGFAAAALLALAICGVDFIAMSGAAMPGIATPGLAISDGATRVPSLQIASPLPLPRKAATREASACGCPWAPACAGATVGLKRSCPGISDELGLAAAAAMRPAAAAVPAPAPKDSSPRDSSPRDITVLATEIATAHDIDPLLVLAVIATESGFQADAVSPGNAQGLMQLMPATARRFGASDLLNPAENIRAGTRYLRWLLAYFEGDLSLALAAYNAGEGAVIHYGGIPPFPETRAYLRKIRTLYPAVAMQ